MKYDFTSVPDRSQCGSSKWAGAPGASVERVPLSTADMEFPIAPAIVEQLKDLVDTTILGYTRPTQNYYDAVCGWMARRHDYRVCPEEIVTTPGVVYALGMLVEAASQPGDSVIVMPPVYYPFDMAVAARGRNLLYNPLALEEGENGRYRIQYEQLEQLAARPDAKVLLFCNPHNPVGQVWSREELEKVVEICARHNVFIIDDEIHNDLIMPGYKHTVLATVSEQARQISAVCTAPSKTFNLAGVQCSNIFIADPEIRAKAKSFNLTNMIMGLNIFAYRACQAAYDQCEDWLEELLPVIQGNAEYVTQFMKEHFPQVRVFPLEGTYLLWLDMRALGMTHVELEKLMKEDAGLYLDEGYIFGQSGRGFERINLACSRLTLERSMARFKEAMDKKQAQWAAEGKPYHKTLAAGQKLEGFVYDAPRGEGLDLIAQMEKPTLVIFSRYYTCGLCQTLLSQLRAQWPAIEKAGYDLKVVLQSTRQSVVEGTKDNPYPIDLVCDPEAKLYDRYNVFEADGSVAMVGGSLEIIKALGGPSKLLGRKGPAEGRSRQLPAAFLVGKDGVIQKAHYGQTIVDLPDAKEFLGI